MTILYACFLFSIGTVSFSLLSKAVEVRRVWEANSTILAARIAAQEMVSLNAQFASIDSREEYQAFDSRVHRLADGNGIHLRAETERLR
jgi:hypothetical protein